MTTTSSPRAKGLNSSMNKLNLSSAPRKTLSSPPSKSKSKPTPPPDSWEEEATNDNDNDPDTPSETSTPTLSGATTPQGGDYPGPPPPTPISPSHRRGKSTDWASFPSEPSSRPSRSTPEDSKRPEKSTATATRMIALSLGQKAPKMGEEQKQYERAVRESERRRVGREKEERERGRREAEEMRRSVWEE